MFNREKRFGAFLLQELQSRGLKIPVLISIRDEDYNITPINGKAIKYNVIELELSEAEAEQIYINLHTFIQIFLIICTKIKHPGCFFSWALPTPGLWNKDGGFWQYYKCRRDKDGDSSIPFRIRCPRLSFLQILCQPFSMEDCQLVQYLIPVPVSLDPLLCHIQAGQIEHLFQ